MEVLREETGGSIDLMRLAAILDSFLSIAYMDLFCK